MIEKSDTYQMEDSATYHWEEMEESVGRQGAHGHAEEQSEEDLVESPARTRDDHGPGQGAHADQEHGQSAIAVP
jgi:hypothetical protein